MPEKTIIDPKFDLASELEALNPGKKNPDASKKIRTKEEVRAVKRKIVQLARIWAEQGLKVFPGEWWQCGFAESGKVVQVVSDYLKGKRDSLEDLPDDFFTPEHINYPEEKLYEESEDEIDGKINHEAGHALHTDFREFFSLQRKAKDEGYLPSTASSIFNAVEDPRVNNMQIGISEHRRKKFNAVYTGWINYHKEKMAEMSVTSAVETLLIAKWVQENLGIIGEKEFKAMYHAANFESWEPFDNLIDASRRYWNEIDHRQATRIFTEEIWPIYRQLEQKAQSNEEINELLREAIKRMKEEQQAQQGQSQGQSQQGQSPGQSQGQPQQGQQPGQSQSQNTIQVPFDKLPPDLQEQIRDLIKEQQGKERGNNSESTGKSGKPAEDAESNSPSSGSPSQNSKAVSKETSDKVKETMGQTGDGNDGEEISDSELPQVPEELKHRIQNSKDECLDQEEKKQLAQKARQRLDKKQAEKLNKEGLPGGQKMEKDPESGEYEVKPQALNESEQKQSEQKVKNIEDQQARDEARRKDLRDRIENAENQQQIDQILQEQIPEEHQHEINNAANAKKELLRQRRQKKIADMRRDGFLQENDPEPDPGEERLYDLYKQYEKEVRPHVAPFVDSIMPHIPKKKRIKYGDRLVRAGSELDNEALGDYGNRVQGYVFKSQEIVEKGDPRIMITLVADCSGSMVGPKMTESMKTAIFFALSFEEISERTGRPVDFSIIFFDDEVFIAKDFTDSFNSKARKRWNDGSIETVKRRMMSGSQRGGSTDLGAAVVQVNHDLNVRKREFPDYMSCMFVISDGDTFGALKGEPLTRFIKGLEAYEGQKMGKHLKIGFFLRGGQSLTPEQKLAETPIEKYFGPRGKGSVVVDDFKDLVPEAKKVLKHALIKMAQRLFT